MKRVPVACCLWTTLAGYGACLRAGPSLFFYFCLKAGGIRPALKISNVDHKKYFWFLDFLIPHFFPEIKPCACGVSYGVFLLSKEQCVWNIVNTSSVLEECLRLLFCDCYVEFARQNEHFIARNPRVASSGHVVLSFSSCPFFLGYGPSHTCFACACFRLKYKSKIEQTLVARLKRKRGVLCCQIATAISSIHSARKGERHKASNFQAV